MILIRETSASRIFAIYNRVSGIWSHTNPSKTAFGLYLVLVLYTLYTSTSYSYRRLYASWHIERNRIGFELSPQVEGRQCRRRRVAAGEEAPRRPQPRVLARAEASALARAHRGAHPFRVE